MDKALKEELTIMGEELSGELLGYLEIMYPRLWAVMSQSCSKSIRGLIKNYINALPTNSHIEIKATK